MIVRCNCGLVTSCHNLEYVDLNLPGREVSYFAYATEIHYNV